MQSVDGLVELFHRNGLRITPQRRVIFELLAQGSSHLTAEAIYQHVMSVMPDVSRTTVYNTLNKLVALGALIAVKGACERGTRYDTNSDDHHHLLCIHCHALLDINRDFEDVELPPEAAAGYQIVKSQVTFYGICPDCQDVQASGKEDSGEERRAV